MNTENINTVVAIAILYQQDHYLMQLRDDIPGIAYPGHWGFFGGHLDPGETPEAGLRRELIEEIDYQAAELKLFKVYPDPGVIRHVFYGSLTVSLTDLVLKEGWDLGFFSLEQIQASQRYSSKAKGTFPLAYPHQKILLDFIEFQTNQFRSLTHTMERHDTELNTNHLPPSRL